MSALANYIRQKIAGRGWNQGQLARAAQIRASTLSNILNKKSIPRPETLIAIAHALDIEPPVLTALAGYPVDSALDPDVQVIHLARRLEAAPWIVARISELLSLSQEEFEELMRYSEFRQSQHEPE